MQTDRESRSVIAFQNWLDRVWSDCELAQGKELTYDELTQVLLKSLRHLDLHVGTDGKIHSPAPWAAFAPKPRDERGGVRYPGRQRLGRRR